MVRQMLKPPKVLWYLVKVSLDESLELLLPSYFFVEKTNRTFAS